MIPLVPRRFPRLITNLGRRTMAVDERTRHEMYSGLEEKLGPDVADALMAHLPRSAGPTWQRSRTLLCSRLRRPNSSSR